jgi:NAD(P)-dependent dehydrogenase (short-subunit alcohol dehydrogenase family)
VQELRDRVAVVTGAAGGIGRALALALAAEGMDVVVADVDGDALEAVADEVRGAGRRSVSVPTDVSKHAAVEALAERTWNELGACHLLCNNAGVIVTGPLSERSRQDWEWVVDVNLHGVANGVQAFVPRMLAMQGERHIVNTASISGLIALPGVGVYSATKFGVVAISETLRAELASEGIGVSVLCPGGVVTRILEADRNRPQELGGSRERATGTLRSVAGSERANADELLTPADVARAVVAGVRDNDDYIFTHSRYRDQLEARHRAMLAALDRAERRGY